MSEREDQGRSEARSGTPLMPSSQPEGESVRTGAHLMPLKLRGRFVLWAILGAALSAAGLLALTGWAATPWLFLLYPLFIGVLIASLGLLALHLIHRI